MRRRCRAWQFKPGHSRLLYRYRPKLRAREDLETGEIEPDPLHGMTISGRL